MGGWWVFYFELNPGYDEASGGTVKVEEVEHYKDGQHHGRAWQKVVDGSVRWEREYENDGTYSSREFYPNGKLELERSLRHYKLEGSRKNYSQAGVLLGDRQFKADQLQHEKVYWESGEPRYEKNYRNAQLDGEYREWNEKGELAVEGEYKGGAKSGMWTVYLPEEKRVGSEINYEGGEPNGAAKFYNAANRVELEGQYRNGEQDGLWKRYDLAGKLKEEVVYEMGREVSKKEYK